MSAAGAHPSLLEPVALQMSGAVLCYVTPVSWCQTCRPRLTKCLHLKSECRLSSKIFTEWWL